MPTTQEDFTNDPRRPVRVLSVKSNGGNVKLQTNVGSSWIDTGDSYSSDGSFIIGQYNQVVRVVPTGGAEYEYQ